MDIISFNEASTANGRIESFIENPDSTSGVLTVPKTIAAGETITIPAGRVAILPDLQVDGDLVVDGDLFIPTGSMTSQVVQKVTSTDNAITRFDGTTGQVQNSAITVDDSGNIGSGTQSFNGFGGSGFKNYIINGDMRIDQWNNGAVVNVTGAGAIVLDRFQPVALQTGKITAQQRVSGAVSMGSAPFENCLQILTVSGYSPIASDQFRVSHKIEGLNIANLRFGKSTAKKITLSFWVRSSVVGLHCVSFRNSSADRSYVATYTINTANNFEYKTITINGDTSGTWIYDTGIGLRIDFNLASGSTYTTSTPNQWVSGSYTGATGVVNDIATTGNEFIITGVQLEEGSIATPFENRPYGLELSLCKRYFEKSYADSVAIGTLTNENAYCTSNLSPYLFHSPIVNFKVPKRIQPTIVIYNPYASNTGNAIEYNTGSVAVSDRPIYPLNVGKNCMKIQSTNGSLVTGNFVLLHYTASAEL